MVSARRLVDDDVARDGRVSRPRDPTTHWVLVSTAIENGAVSAGEE